MTSTTTAAERAIAANLLEDWLPAQQERLGIVGLCAGVVLPDGETLTTALGLADRENGRAMTVETPLRVASITKMFSATAMMIARDAGLLALDEPLSRLVPELATLRNPAPDNAPITLRQLVSHTAGLPHDLPENVQYWDRDDAIVFPTAEEMRADLVDLELIFSPMTTSHYSNVGYMLVGLALGAAFGQRVEQVIAERILTPLAMDDSFFFTPQRQDELARSYRRRGATLELAPHVDISWDNAGGGLCCSVADLMGFAKLHLSDAAVGDANVLGGSSVREMRQPVFMAPGWDGGIGLGWRLARKDDTLIVAHSGGIYGFSSHLALAPEFGLAVTVLANTGVVQVAPLVEGMLATIVAAAKTAAFADRYQSKPPPAGAERYIGHYESFEFSFDVIAVGDRLAMTILGEIGLVSWLEPTAVEGVFIGGDGFARGERVVFAGASGQAFSELRLQGQVYRRS